MIEAIKRNALILIGLVLCGAACMFAAGALTSPRGALGPTLFGAESPMLAVLVMVVCLAGATVVAGLVGRLVNPVVGMFVLGAGLFALAGRMETMVEMAFSAAPLSGRVRLVMASMETIVWAALVLAASLAVFRMASSKEQNPDVDEEGSGGIWSADALKAAAMGVVVLVAVWLIARSPMKGQTIGATFWGGLAAGMLGRSIAHRAQPVLLFPATILFGAIGQLIGAIVLTGRLDHAYILQELTILSVPMPIDYAAGSLMGVAMGWGWAESLRHKPHDQPVVARLP